ncbi:lysylphosphatidylglycerol synthase domain-containing protein [Phenylobacterium soli]|uniref:lysylphosphatidylglycerol synthase domain-containing protein n=1 Tax=Phenylobacterium soli TaxID=2170551 RepID=UPI0014036A32|nr:lysylphosphatidylglycerol synthase domain-containing protein [Phenylobacterium soli]
MEPVEVELAEALPTPQAKPLARVTKLALRIVPLVLLVAAVFVLRREFKGLSWDAVGKAMDGWGHLAIIAALVLAVLSFLLMGVVEWLGLRWAGAKLPWGVAVAGSFLAGAIGHAIGANLLVAGAVRARLYDRYGVTLTQVAVTTLFNGMSFAVGLGALGGGGLLLASQAELAATAIPVSLARSAGAVLLAGSLGWVLLCMVRRRPLSAFGRSLTLPAGRDAVLQLIIGVADNGIAAGIVWVLLPHGTTSYASFVGAYAVACVAGLISSVPGGAGVFESAISTLLPKAEAAPLAAAFLGYRLAYYLLPLIIASAALFGDTLLERLRKR